MAYKSSKQRDIIMDYMSGIHGHVSAEKIFADLNKHEKMISLATVYRNLNIPEKNYALSPLQDCSCDIQHRHILR
ncbi:MAG: hypothetical protein EOM11_07050 [Erysipelotrichia bacterium]|nr:hypothetical protein [Erysipelotrichia bacterium]